MKEKSENTSDDPNELFSLTEEMIISIKKDVIPRIIDTYDINSREEYIKLNEESEIDNVDMLQVMEGEFEADKILGIDKKDYDDIEDYSYDRDELWMEKFEIEESQVKINLGIDWLEENSWQKE